MRGLAIVHQRDSGPGVFAEAIDAAGGELDRWHIVETDTPPADPLGYDAIFALGGAMNVDEEDRHPWLRTEKRLLGELLGSGMPLMGVCLGAQLLSEAAGGAPRRAREPEIGWYEVEVTDAGAEDPVIGPLAPRFEAFEWHSYETGLPADALVLARTPICDQAYRLGERAWGIQFHAEVAADDALGWIEHYDVDPDAVRLGIDPVAFHAETEPRIEAWNQLGRELCERFLAAVAGSS